LKVLLTFKPALACSLVIAKTIFVLGSFLYSISLRIILIARSRYGRATNFPQALRNGKAMAVIT
jgi:hypothetical protein